MERDERATFSRWMHLRSHHVVPSIGAHGGTVVNDTGDGYLVEFPTTLGAVRWAIALQHDLSRLQAGANDADLMQIRIAIHVGEVFHSAGNIYGEDVNIVARLQQHSEPGGVILSNSVFQDLEIEHRPDCELIGPLFLKNIERPITAHRVSNASPRPTDRSYPITTHRPTIAVLPFRIIGDGSLERYFAEGIAHEIVGSLSSLKELFVIASSSTLGFGSDWTAQTDPTDAGRRLSVRYLLTGTVSSVQSRLRLIAELSDLQTRFRLWSSRHDIAEDELFETQDVIAAEVANHLVPHLRQMELQHARHKPPDSQDAYDLFLQALHTLYRFGEGDFETARRLLQRAVDRDPEYALAHAMLAKWHVLNYGQGYTSEKGASAEAACAHAQTAVDLNRSDPLVLALYGHTLAFLRGELEQAVSVFEQAIAAGPSCAIAWAYSSPTYAYLGNGPEAVVRARYALRLSPLDPYAFFYQGILGMAHYFNDAFSESVEKCYRVYSVNPRFTANIRVLVAGLVALDRVNEARDVASVHRTLDPRFEIKKFQARYPVREQDRLQVYCERLASAGL